MKQESIKEIFVNLQHKYYKALLSNKVTIFDYYKKPSDFKIDEYQKLANRYEKYGGDRIKTVVVSANIYHFTAVTLIYNVGKEYIIKNTAKNRYVFTHDTKNNTYNTMNYWDAIDELNDYWL